MKKTTFIICLALFLVGGNSLLFSQMVQKDLQAQFILKLVSLDRNLTRYQTPIKIGVSSHSMFRALKRFGKMKIKGRAFEANLMSTLDEISGQDVVYVDKNWESNYAAAYAKAKEKQALMFSASAKAVERGEAGVAFKMVLGKPKIVMNLKAVKDLGSNFPADLLKLTLLVGDI